MSVPYLRSLRNPSKTRRIMCPSAKYHQRKNLHLSLVLVHPCCLDHWDLSHVSFRSFVWSWHQNSYDPGLFMINLKKSRNLRRKIAFFMAINSWTIFKKPSTLFETGGWSSFFYVFLFWVGLDSVMLFVIALELRNKFPNFSIF